MSNQVGRENESRHAEDGKQEADADGLEKPIDNGPPSQLRRAGKMLVIAGSVCCVVVGLVLLALFVHDHMASSKLESEAARVSAKMCVFNNGEPGDPAFVGAIEGDNVTALSVIGTPTYTLEEVTCREPTTSVRVDDHNRRLYYGSINDPVIQSQRTWKIRVRANYASVHWGVIFYWWYSGSTTLCDSDSTGTLIGAYQEAEKVKTVNVSLLQTWKAKSHYCSAYNAQEHSCTPDNKCTNVESTSATFGGNGIFERHKKQWELYY